MKTKRKSENLCFTVCDVILCFLMVFVSLNDVLGSGMPNDNQKILSRRRRYLTFPEGSSFQVVYETYQPIPGYGNLLIFYLTQALAWELPHDPYHPEEHLQDLWDDVVFPNDEYDEVVVNNQIASDNQVANAAAYNLQNSQVADAAAYNSQNSIQNQLEDKNNVIPSQNGNLNPKNSQNLLGNSIQNQNQQGAQIQNRNGFENNNGSRIGNKYYGNSYNPSAPNRYYYSNYQNPPKLSDTIAPLTKAISNKMDYYFSYADKVLNQITDLASEKHEPWTKTDWTTYSQRPRQPSYYQKSEANRNKYAFEQSRNFIHPAFGKRSTDQVKTPEESFNLKYHRTSRQTMYQKIAKFLDSDEINGAECVLKALCETGKRRDTDKKPGPFLMEILRVIFSLPETNEKEVHPVYSQYDHAHSTPMDCDELFWKCKSNLWNKNEILQ